MKTIKEFKSKMTIGAIVNTKIFHRAPVTGKLVLQREIKNRICTISQTNSFALSLPNQEQPGWCKWPLKSEFTVLNENMVQIDFSLGRIIYEFV